MFLQPPLSHCPNSSHKHTFQKGPTTQETQPHARRSVCGVECVCHGHAETQQGKALVFSIHSPPIPLINIDTHISLTSPPTLSSDALAKPAIGLKSAKHNPTILFIRWTTCRRETTGKNKGAGGGFMSRLGSAPPSPLVSERSSD